MIEFEYYPSQPVHFLVHGASPKTISINGKSLNQVHQPTTRNPGWWQPKNTTRTYITTPPQKGQGLLEIRFQ